MDNGVGCRLVCQCGRRYKHQFSMMCHLYGECGALYRCERCSFTTNKLHMWLRHVQTQEYETGQFLVKDPWYAGDSYEFSSLLVNAKRYTCTCGKFYSQKSSLDRHLRYECGKMPNVPCPQCGKMFKHKHHVTQHLKSCAGQRKTAQRRQQPAPYAEDGQQALRRRFYCESCGKSYKWKESLKKHKRIECGKLPQIPCEVCGHRFMHKHHLLKHVNSVHQMLHLNGATVLASQ
ncbi:zinc finger E-box-binding homeobox 2-like [Andrena cerasifolii]|uniref:zinc finger E-box-binding homeobox 2-like n=1 Tax=Andrena cerasifolii TaxID=2819439 RepID=UPI004037A097